MSKIPINSTIIQTKRKISDYDKISGLENLGDPMEFTYNGTGSPENRIWTFLDSLIIININESESISEETTFQMRIQGAGFRSNQEWIDIIPGQVYKNNFDIYIILDQNNSNLNSSANDHAIKLGWKKNSDSGTPILSFLNKKGEGKARFVEGLDYGEDSDLDIGFRRVLNDSSGNPTNITSVNGEENILYLKILGRPKGDIIYPYPTNPYSTERNIGENIYITFDAWAGDSCPLGAGNRYNMQYHGTDGDPSGDKIPDNDFGIPVVDNDSYGNPSTTPNIGKSFLVVSQYSDKRKYPNYDSDIIDNTRIIKSDFYNKNANFGKYKDVLDSKSNYIEKNDSRVNDTPSGRPYAFYKFRVRKVNNYLFYETESNSQPKPPNPIDETIKKGLAKIDEYDLKGSNNDSDEGYNTNKLPFPGIAFISNKNIYYPLEPNNNPPYESGAILKLNRYEEGNTSFIFSNPSSVNGDSNLMLEIGSKIYVNISSSESSFDIKVEYPYKYDDNNQIQRNDTCYKEITESVLPFFKGNCHDSLEANIDSVAIEYYISYNEEEFTNNDLVGTIRITDIDDDGSISPDKTRCPLDIDKIISNYCGIDSDGKKLSIKACISISYKYSYKYGEKQTTGGGCLTTTNGSGSGTIDNLVSIIDKRNIIVMYKPIKSPNITNIQYKIGEKDWINGSPKRINIGGNKLYFRLDWEYDWYPKQDVSFNEWNTTVVDGENKVDVLSQNQFGIASQFYFAIFRSKIKYVKQEKSEPTFSIDGFSTYDIYKKVINGIENDIEEDKNYYIKKVDCYLNKNYKASGSIELNTNNIELESSTSYSIAIFPVYNGSEARGLAECSQENIPEGIRVGPPATVAEFITPWNIDQTSGGGVPSPDIPKPNESKPAIIYPLDNCGGWPDDSFRVLIRMPYDNNHDDIVKKYGKYEYSDIEVIISPESGYNLNSGGPSDKYRFKLSEHPEAFSISNIKDIKYQGYVVFLPREVRDNREGQNNRRLIDNSEFKDGYNILVRVMFSNQSSREYNQPGQPGPWSQLSNNPHVDRLDIFTQYYNLKYDSNTNMYIENTESDTRNSIEKIYDKYPEYNDKGEVISEGTTINTYKQYEKDHRYGSLLEPEYEYEENEYPRPPYSTENTNPIAPSNPRYDSELPNYPDGINPDIDKTTIFTEYEDIILSRELYSKSGDSKIYPNNTTKACNTIFDSNNPDNTYSVGAKKRLQMDMSDLQSLIVRMHKCYAEIPVDDLGNENLIGYNSVMEGPEDKYFNLRFYNFNGKIIMGWHFIKLFEGLLDCITKINKIDTIYNGKYYDADKEYIKFPTMTEDIPATSPIPEIIGNRVSNNHTDDPTDTPSNYNYSKGNRNYIRLLLRNIDQLLADTK